MGCGLLFQTAAHGQATGTRDVSAGRRPARRKANTIRDASWPPAGGSAPGGRRSPTCGRVERRLRGAGSVLRGNAWHFQGKLAILRGEQTAHNPFTCAGISKGRGLSWGGLLRSSMTGASRCCVDRESARRQAVCFEDSPRPFACLRAPLLVTTLQAPVVALCCKLLPVNPP